MSVSVFSLVGIVAGSITAWILSKKKASSFLQSPLVRLVLLGVLAVAWCVCMVVTTFGAHAPGHAFGNYFLGAWGSFGLTIFLFKQTLREYLLFQGFYQRRPRRRSKSASKKNKRTLNKKGGVPGLVVEDDEEEMETEIGRSSSSGSQSFPIRPCNRDVTVPRTPTHLADTPKQKHHQHQIMQEAFEMENVDPEMGGSVRIIQPSNMEEELPEHSDRTTRQRGSGNHHSFSSTATTPNSGNRTRGRRWSGSGESTASSSRRYRSSVVQEEDGFPQNPPFFQDEDLPHMQQHQDY